MNYNSNAPTHSLYVHWPFCPYKCDFCPFVALAGQDRFMHKYHESLKAEIIRFATRTSRPLLIDTIFFGGGTPSTYPNDLLLDMLDTLKSVFTLDGNGEISIEVNPGTVHIPDQLYWWKQLGINRLSIGVQSLKDDVLRRLNRHQKAVDVCALIQAAAACIENISIDLIVGLPGVTVQEWYDLIYEVMTWPLKHISLYFLTVHEHTPLHFKVKKGQVDLPCDDTMVTLYHWTVEQLAQHGFEQYEMSNFARSGFACRHNQVYWNRKPYKGFGLGAWSFDGTSRFENEKNLLSYLDGIAHERDVTSYAEQLTDQQVKMEHLMLGLRRSCGLAIDELFYGLSSEAHEQMKREIELCIEQGFIKQEKDRVKLTPTGLVVENQIIVRLMR